MPFEKPAFWICLLTLCLFPALSNVRGSLPAGPPLFPGAPGPGTVIKEGRVRPGESISQILDPYLPLDTVYRLNRESRTVFPLQRIRPGQAFRISVKDGQMVRFEYEIHAQCRLVIQKQDQGFSIEKMPMADYTSLAALSAVIDDNLGDAVKAAGGTLALAGQVARIFAWDIDFSRDLRPGDQVSLVVEKQFHRERFIGYGRILAARFRTRGQEFLAFALRKSDGSFGYFDSQGRSLEKAFLRSPVSDFRITSRFNLKRMHPILKEYRSHPAVDYAAPMGTPVRAVGHGTITALGFSPTMGNFVKIRHSGGYLTQYFHLKRIETALGRGGKVTQGQVIGLLGMTGYATGPHLCFRMTKDGHPVDPLGCHTPSETALTGAQRKRFLALADILSQQLPKIRIATQDKGSDRG